MKILHKNNNYINTVVINAYLRDLVNNMKGMV